MTTPTSLESLIDNAITDLLSLSKDLRAKEADGKPAISPKELTEAIRVAVEFWDKKRGSAEDGWGSKLGPGKAAA
jgi:hypothetical protein